MEGTSKTGTGLEQELVALERQYWQAIQDRDVDAAMRLSDTSCIVAGAQGVGKLDRASLGAMMKASSYTLDRFRFDDTQVTSLTPDVAVLAYKVHEQLTVEGKQVELDANETSTWVRRDGTWRCALHTESLAGDPFGRDRQRPAPSAAKGLA
jgi:ketosteroid isomerase-like protein